MTGSPLPGGYVPLELLAELWSDDMARRFPSADHSECMSEVTWKDGAVVSVTCRGWHCNRCGVAVNPLSSHGCLDRVER